MMNIHNLNNQRSLEGGGGVGGLRDGVKYEGKWGEGRSKVRREMEEVLIDGGKVRREMAEVLIQGVKYKGKWRRG